MDKTANTEKSGFRFTTKHYAWAGVALAFALTLWYFRPIGMIHGPLMLIYKYPLLVVAPLFFGLLTFATIFVVQKKITNKDGRAKLFSSYRDYPAVYINFWATGIVATVALGIAMIIVGPLMGRATYEAYTYTEIDALPDGGSVRIIPKQVAETMASNGYNSSTESLKQAHIVNTPDGLVWSFEQAPDGAFRKYTKSSAGAGYLNASSTARDFELTNQDLSLSPSMKFFDNFNFHAYKLNYFSDVAETSFIVGEDGEVLMIAPYIKYEGFLVKHPVLGGVYVVHADGEIEDLSPEEAAARTELADSGRVFSEALARQIQEAYKYKNGVLNAMFGREDKIEISDSGDNQQPYLMDFEEEGTEWVTTAQPAGKSYATNSIFLTNTVTGETQLWRADDEAALTGNTKALETVEGLSIPGVVFSGDSDEGGKFDAVEPRPVFIDGQLHFLISIIPDSHNTVTKSVIVDAATNKVTAIFDHDTNPDADQELIDYLTKGQLDDENEADIGLDEPETDTPQTDTPNSSSLTDQETAEILRQLRENQAEQDALIDELESRLSK